MAGLLGITIGDLAQMADRVREPVKTRLRDLVNDPVEYIKRNAAEAFGRFNDSLFASTSVMPDVSGPALQDLVTGGLLGFAPVGATVWHGSPHKFDKFDAGKIGTGEGAQAYGHGLYLADHPSVSKSYMTAGSDKAYSRVTGGMTPMEEFAYDMATKGVVGEDLHSVMWQRYGNRLKTDSDFNAFDAAIKSAEAARGNLYKVDLPDNAIARMLDWDKPLSQQEPEVQKALTKAWLAQPDGAHAQQTVPQMLDALTISLYGTKKGAADTSQMLRQAGIPGIRYLDGGSRSAGTGTSNYVVFPGEEGLLTILERNGIPVR